MRFLFVFICCLHFTTLGWSSRIVEVLPLTNRIIMVHFDDGYINYHGRGQNSSSDVIVNTPLNVVNASMIGSYQITSVNDVFYNTSRFPIDVGRKSKGTDFSGICEGWEYLPLFDEMGCANPFGDHVKEHWIYIVLPSAMIEGAEYFLSTGSLAEGDNDFNFVFNPRKQRSEAVHVSQAGYLRSSTAKFAYLYHWMGDKGGLDLSEFVGKPFYVTDSSGANILYEGTIQFRMAADNVETGQASETPNGNFLGADVLECDFSSLVNENYVKIVVPNLGSSFPFEISRWVYNAAFEYLLYGIYGNRSGIELTAPAFAPRPIDHHVQETPGFAGKLKYTTTTWCEVSGEDADLADKALWESGIQGNLTDTWGWYHDAGDWDGYLRHNKIPTYLMFMIDHHWFDLSYFYYHYPNDQLSQGQNPILNEISVLLDFNRRLRHELLDKGWGTGGVGGSRVFGDLWGNDLGSTGLGRGSWEDTDRTWVVSGEDAFATYWYAGMAAHYNQLLGGSNESWLEEAVDAYAWAKNNEPANSVCHSYNLRDLRMYAAASLYRLTGEAIYKNDFEADFNSMNLSGTDIELTDTRAFGIWQYLNTSYPTNPSIAQTALDAVLSTGEFQLFFSGRDRRACRWGGNFWFPMLVGQSTTPLINEGVMAYHLIKNSDPQRAYAYKEIMETTAAYFLGNNPLNTTWITGYGERYPKQIFHLDSWYSGSTEVRKGIVPYGPWRREYYGPYGPWRNDWSAKTTYPALDEWPGHERWFDQRPAPLTAEFTVDQTNLSAAFLLGSMYRQTFSSTDDKATTPAIESVKAYPNPTEDLLFLEEKELPLKEVVLITKLGRTMTVPVTGNTLTVGHLPQGLYFIRYKNNLGVPKMSKFLKF